MPLTNVETQSMHKIIVQLTCRSTWVPLHMIVDLAQQQVCVLSGIQPAEFRPVPEPGHLAVAQLASGRLDVDHQTQLSRDGGDGR